MNEVRTSSTELDQHLKGPDFLDIKQYPTAKFVSTAVKVDGTTAEITGHLTLPGVTHPVTRDSQSTGAGTQPMTQNHHLGFSRLTTLRSTEHTPDSHPHIPIPSPTLTLHQTTHTP